VYKEITMGLHINVNAKASEFIATTITGNKPFYYSIVEVNDNEVTIRPTKEKEKADISFVYRSANANVVGASTSKKLFEKMHQPNIKPRTKILVKEKLFSRQHDLILMFDQRVSAANSNIPIMSFDPQNA